jgi:hypothetical protein
MNAPAIWLTTILTALFSVFSLSAAPAVTTSTPAPHVHHLMRSMLRSGEDPAGTQRDTNPLTYSGGPVQTKPAVYLVFWGPQWLQGFASDGYTSQTMQAYIESFFGLAGGTSWIATQTQYCQGASVGATSCAGAPSNQHVGDPVGQLKGQWTDPSPVPPTIPSTNGADVFVLGAEALKATSQFGYDANATYMIFTPPGVTESGLGSSFCAWHADVPDPATSQSIAFAFIPWQPDFGRSCGQNLVNWGSDAFGHGYFDGFSIVAGHEYAEALTDPFPNTGLAWQDDAGNENGDKCAWIFGGQGAMTNLYWGNQYFAVQSLWSNACNNGRGGCVVS